MAPTKIITVMEARRRKLGITQIDLAIAVGVTQAVISQYERGYLVGIQTETVNRIARELGIADSHDLLMDFVEYELRQRDKALDV